MLGDMQPEQHYLGLVAEVGTDTRLPWMYCEMPPEENTHPLSVSILATGSSNSPDEAIYTASQQLPRAVLQSTPANNSDLPGLNKISPAQTNTVIVSSQMEAMPFKHHDMETMVAGTKALVFVEATPETFELNRKEASFHTMTDGGNHR